MSLPVDQRDALTLLARLFLTQGFPEKAARLYAVLDLLEPNDLQHLRGLALAQMRSGRAEDSISTLDRLAQQGGIDEGFHALRSQVLYDLGRHDEAAASMRAFMEIKDPPQRRQSRTSATTTMSTPSGVAVASTTTQS